MEKRWKYDSFLSVLINTHKMEALGWNISLHWAGELMSPEFCLQESGELRSLLCWTLYQPTRQGKE